MADDKTKKDAEQVVEDVKNDVAAAAEKVKKTTAKTAASAKAAGEKLAADANATAAEIGKKMDETADEASAAAKNIVETVRSETAEVLSEASAALSGQTIQNAPVGAAGYRTTGSGSNGKAIASLVLGVISLLLGVFGTGYNWLGLITGVVGIVLGAMARKENQTGLATAGFVCSIIGTVLSVIFFLACVICIGAIGAAGAGAAAFS